MPAGVPKGCCSNPFLRHFDECRKSDMKCRDRLLSTGCCTLHSVDVAVAWMPITDQTTFLSITSKMFIKLILSSRMPSTFILKPSPALYDLRYLCSMALDGKAKICCMHICSQSFAPFIFISMHSRIQYHEYGISYTPLRFAATNICNTALALAITFEP